MAQTATLHGTPLLLLRLEGAGVLLLALAGFAHTGESWWLFAVLFLAPDLSMLGYLTGPRNGAIIYNAVHSYLAPMALGLAGLRAGRLLPVALALIWAGHIGFDRLMGYGLKYPASFGDTHLGRIGRAK